MYLQYWLNIVTSQWCKRSLWGDLTFGSLYLGVIDVILAVGGCQENPWHAYPLRSVSGCQWRRPRFTEMSGEHVTCLPSEVCIWVSVVRRTCDMLTLWGLYLGVSCQENMWHANPLRSVSGCQLSGEHVTCLPSEVCIWVSVVRRTHDMLTLWGLYLDVHAVVLAVGVC